MIFVSFQMNFDKAAFSNIPLIYISVENLAITNSFFASFIWKFGKFKCKSFRIKILVFDFRIKSEFLLI